MLSFALLALAASAEPQPAAVDGRSPGTVVRATARATVTLLEARRVPMSSESGLDLRQRVTTIFLADGEHRAIIVEFE